MSTDDALSRIINGALRSVARDHPGAIRPDAMTSIAKRLRGALLNPYAVTLRTRHEEERDLAILMLRANGRSLPEIAAATGYSKSLISIRLRVLGAVNMKGNAA